MFLNFKIKNHRLNKWKHMWPVVHLLLGVCLLEGSDEMGNTLTWVPGWPAGAELLELNKQMGHLSAVHMHMCKHWPSGALECCSICHRQSQTWVHLNRPLKSLSNKHLCLYYTHNACNWYIIQIFKMHIMHFASSCVIQMH